MTVVGKPGCHLCDDATEVISSVLVDFPDATLEHVSLEDNPLWEDLYGERIPVVLLNGVEHAQWRVDPERLRYSLRTLHEAELQSSPPEQSPEA